MPRFECVKNIFMDDGDPAFLAGKVYPGIRENNRTKFTSEIGPAHYITDPFLKVHFKELEQDLPIPNDIV